MPRNNQDLLGCIRECNQCADICVRCSVHCLQMGGEHAGIEHQTVMQDCADACVLSARVMGRGSERHMHVCGLCAEFCRACEDSCNRLANGDRMMRECADACRRCAESCERMAGAGV